MSVYLRFRSAVGSIALNGVSRNGFGVESLAGVSGLGLPPVSTQWIAGAGDGAIYRGTRVQTRDIDIPLYFFQPDRDSLAAEMRRMALMLAAPFALDVVDDDGSYWTTDVVRVGGGDFVYGDPAGTLGETELRTVVTVRAGDPFFTSSRQSSLRVSNAGAGRSLLNTLSKLQVSASQAIGDMLLVNDGDAPAWPVWDVVGPGKGLSVRLLTGEGFSVPGVLGAGTELRIDARTAAVTNLATQANAYGLLAPAPAFFPIPAGTTDVVVTMTDTTAASSITVTWRARKWWTI